MFLHSATCQEAERNQETRNSVYRTAAHENHNFLCHHEDDQQGTESFGLDNVTGEWNVHCEKACPFVHLLMISAIKLHFIPYPMENWPLYSGDRIMQYNYQNLLSHGI